MKQIIINRENTYKFLSQVYKTEVTEKLYQELKRMDFDSLSDTVFAEGYKLIKKFIDEKREDAVTDLAVDYAKVFLGAGLMESTKSASPYESVYTSKERLIMQDARDKVLEIYRKNGVDRAKNFDVPEDHIAIELDFMAHLCSKSLEAFDSKDKEEYKHYTNEQIEFLSEHLLNWVEKFCGEVAHFSETDFYKGAAILTKEYLFADLEILGGIKEPEF